MVRWSQCFGDDADATYQRALAAGATSVSAPTHQFWGDRQGAVKDAWGNQWWIATRVEDLSAEEIQRRGADWMKQHEAKAA